jgi:hypothetical protein
MTRTRVARTLSVADEIRQTTEIGCHEQQFASHMNDLVDTRVVRRQACVSKQQQLVDQRLCVTHTDTCKHVCIE